jgi:hypothetical protein
LSFSNIRRRWGFNLICHYKEVERRNYMVVY